MRHRRLPRLDLPGHTYYLTCCLDRRRPLFRQHQLAEFLISLYAAARGEGKIALHGYVVMPDHYHVLLTLKGETSLSSLVRAVHSLFARYCRATTRFQGRIWQRRFYDRVVRSESDWREKLTYLHGNPVRAGLVDNPADHLSSSFRFWQTGAGPIRCDGLE